MVSSRAIANKVATQRYPISGMAVSPPGNIQDNSYMNYYIKETQVNDQNSRTAGSKARDNLDIIFEDVGMQPIYISSKGEKRESLGIIRKTIAHIGIAQIWSKETACLGKGDTVFIQFPVEEHTLLLSEVVNTLKKKGVRIEIFIHDLELFRYAKRGDFTYKRRFRIYLEEKSIFKKADGIVVHNQEMKDKLKETSGIDPKKMVTLEIFDYLIPDYERKQGEKITMEGPVIISGNLHPDKAGYVYSLPDSVEFNLYGVNYKENNKDNVKYCGSFLPSEIPFAMSGSFGLVWDGDSSDTCSGVYGEYLYVTGMLIKHLYIWYVEYR